MSPGEGGVRGFRPRFLRNRAFLGVPPRSGSGFERNEGAPSPTTKQQRQGNGKDNLGNRSKGTRRAVAVIRLAARRISRRRCALIVSGNSFPPRRARGTTNQETKTRSPSRGNTPNGLGGFRRVLLIPPTSPLPLPSLLPRGFARQHARSLTSLP